MFIVLGRRTELYKRRNFDMLECGSGENALAHSNRTCTLHALTLAHTYRTPPFEES